MGVSFIEPQHSNLAQITWKDCGKSASQMVSTRTDRTRAPPTKSLEDKHAVS
jgi:hypothetical protein